MTKKTKNLSNSEIEQAGRLLAFIYESNFVSYKRMLWLSFVRGIFRGIGAFIGATIGISILIWLFSVFTGVPVVGQFIENIKETLNQQPTTP